MGTEGTRGVTGPALVGACPQAEPAPQQVPGAKTARGEQGEKDALGLVVWRICFFGDLSSSFASLVAMAAQALP